MRAAETIAGLTSFERRGAGTDSERRAARWLANEIQRAGRKAEIETFWCRPNWALAHAWHVALAIAGSLVSVSSPRVGGALLVAAFVSVLADALTGVSPGRRLTFERASQNVIAVPPSPPPEGEPRVQLIITANYDAGRTGIAYRESARETVAAVARAAGGLTPGWLGWLSLAIIWLLAVAILRLQGDHSTVVGALQLLATAGLLMTLALLVDLAGGDYVPAAADNASGTTAALALVSALDAGPPRHMAVGLVLEGAGDGGGIGLRKYLRARKRVLVPSNAIVIGFAASGAGTTHWWHSDGQLVPLRYFPRLRQMCAEIVGGERQLEVRAHHGRGLTPAFPARLARLPAITIGALDERGLVPHSHRPTDLPESIESASLERSVEFGLMLVDAIDAYLDESAARQTAVVNG